MDAGVAPNFARVRSDLRQHALIAVFEQRDGVREIELAMRVFRAQRSEHRPEFGQGKAVDAGIDFANGALLGGGAFVLDDGHHAALLVANDAAIAAGIFNFGGEDSGGGFSAAVRVDERGESFSAQKRRVARKNHGKLGAAFNGAARDLHGVAGATLRLLQNGLRTQRFGDLPHRFGLMAHDGEELSRFQRLAGADDVLE